MTSFKKYLPMRFLALACIWASVLVVPTFVQGEEWQVQVGAQGQNMEDQALAFLPNELWIHAGDSIAFLIATDEKHTVTFLKPAQVRLPFAVGCPGTTPSGASEDGSSCVNSGVLANGQGYTVMFPKAGNYKLVCLVARKHDGSDSCSRPGRAASARPGVLQR